jgi:hypothetical protein
MATIFGNAPADSIDNSTSSNSQTPIPFKLFFECFAAGRIVEDVGQCGAEFAL